jgi:hypothetical protein
LVGIVVAHHRRSGRGESESVRLMFSIMFSLMFSPMMCNENSNQHKSCKTESTIEPSLLVATSLLDCSGCPTYFRIFEGLWRRHDWKI